GGFAFFLFLVALLAKQKELMLTAPLLGAILRQLLGGDGLHADAVDRAGCNAEVATRAQVRNDGMHQLGSADDGIDRTGLDARGAADADRFVDEGHHAW